MSNLFKYHMVQCDSDKKVIDYNELIAEKLSKLQSVANNKKQPDEGVDTNGFQAGLFAREVSITEEIQEQEEIVLSPEEIIENAKLEASKLIEEANQQAELIKQEAFESANKAGYDEGYQQAITQVKKQEEQLMMQQNKMLAEYQSQLEKMEPLLVDAIITVVQNVFKIKFEDNRNLIVHLLKIALGQIESSNDIIIKVSKEDYPFLLKYKEVLSKTVTKNIQINIMEEISLTKNQCLIETDGGVFDCSLDVQLDNLSKTLRILSLS
ncbi:MAG: hypothetical protein H2184_07285 [Candidatus Galacturonibacter soehngenii]|nr:hypothetical protein [Candidatus Galacturonibacter soehngenii]